ncbi:DNA polymerase III subunit gamma/tau [Wolbachia endosymbiont of Brugia malayi]|uniref:DNA polymerase III subunit gamma/tau n=1 Tax=Wolbachia endosymbiont of Brugia malayi TaxID=80849 RepID=UPI00004C93BE|nr:DNA polymerase III subunit gamma/tau [Wolbachia endosymbiont of Brugia malayi]AAW71022.1 DNA polymerase III, gamma/tau subunit [Wolbachia endosymbiont strain TRS of Brugia malayi]QCB61968.1 DNA polymerase III subunit gamma/tau [Wolbachia endosymbiont of Brugia malayi]
MNIALKYRPGSFKDLVGQDILVRILENAFTLNRIPQSILLSGASGVGKTTTARIIALCLNCSLGPTFEPCGSCKNCLTIKNSSHPDVIEIDAASHTSVDDIKVILGDICYSPISSKFKVYIIDEVHMLSSSAFNALLKTLEEPPPSVKFILATTEIKKIPITIIARCQRFDLYNIPVAKIVERLNDIAQRESYFIEKEASELIARHSGNSMRNALFLMNQAVLYNKGGVISTKSVMDILGLVDKDIIFDLMEAILGSDLQKALSLFDKAVETANPLSIFEGLLQTIQLICRFLVTKEIDSSVTECEKNRIKDLGVKKSLIFFSRLWRMLLKGVQDIKASTCSDVAAEMILISLCYLSDLPSPEQVVKKVLAQSTQQRNTRSAENIQQKSYDFDKILQLLQQNNQIYLYKQLCSNLQLVNCKPGYLKLKAVSQLDSNFCNDLKNYLSQITQQEWVITIDAGYIKKGASSLSYAPAVKGILDTFKGAKVVNIENKE